jgi:hypothetical protein
MWEREAKMRDCLVLPLAAAIDQARPYKDTE